MDRCFLRHFSSVQLHGKAFTEPLIFLGLLFFSNSLLHKGFENKESRTPADLGVARWGYFVAQQWATQINERPGSIKI
jgi:hypothetical protein